MRSGEVEGGVDQRVGLGVLLARHVRELDVLVLGEQLPRPLVVRPKVRLLHPVPAFELTDDQLRIGPDAYAPAGNSRAASSAATRARYSATLFVATPMRSLTVVSRVGGSVDGSSTTAPIAAGPGLPRAPPSQ